MGKNIEETIEYDNKLVDQYNRIRERENGPYAYKHIKKKKTITKDNDFELWLELQAMNCMYILYQDEIENEDELKSGLFSKKKNTFEMPVSDYNSISKNCKRLLAGEKQVFSDILEDIEDMCQENNLNNKDKDRVKELYPCLYAYVIMIEDEDVEEKELNNILSSFSSNVVEDKKDEELVVHESKSSYDEEQETPVYESKPSHEEKRQLSDYESLIAHAEEKELSARRTKPSYIDETEISTQESKTSIIEQTDDLSTRESKVPYIEEDEIAKPLVQKPILVEEDDDDDDEKADENIKITFDDTYLNFRNGKYEGQEEGDYVYSNKINGELICRENDNSLWLKLQAMNFINKLFKQELKDIKEYNLLIEDDNSKKVFTVPEKETVIAIRMYNRSADEKDLKSYLYGLCKKYNVKDTIIEKIFELYPYFCAYVWVKSYNISVTKALVELKNIPKLIYDSQEEYDIEEEQEKFRIDFDNEYYKYKVAIMEDNTTIYCDEANSSYVSEENQKELWLKLQAMNFISKVYKLDNNKDFVLPENLYLDVVSNYVNDDKVTENTVKSICESKELDEKEFSKVLDLYPYFYAYVISEKNSLSFETAISIAEKVKDMLNGKEDDTQQQENTMVLNIPKEEIIDKFLNRMNQQKED